MSEAEYDASLWMEDDQSAGNNFLVCARCSGRYHGWAACPSRDTNDLGPPAVQGQAHTERSE